MKTILLIEDIRLISEKKYIRASIPKGSRLDPFLFVVYVNDIAKKFKSSAGLYADNCSLAVTNFNKDITHHKHFGVTLSKGGTKQEYNFLSVLSTRLYANAEICGGSI